MHSVFPLPKYPYIIANFPVLSAAILLKSLLSEKFKSGDGVYVIVTDNLCNLVEM